VVIVLGVSFVSLGMRTGIVVALSIPLVLAVVVLIFGEVTPKSLAKEMPETVATAVAPVLSLLMVVFTPLTWLFSQWKRLLNRFVHSSESEGHHHRG
jgi:CBS domain containing-hemolysin-like protein